MPPRAFSRSTAKLQETVGGGAAPFRIARRKMRADIAVGERAENGIDQRMQHHVGVGMPGQPAVMGDAHAAEHDVIAVAKGMHVEAHAGADVGKLFDQHRFGSQEIVGRGEFDVGNFTLESRDRQSRPFGQRGIVGKVELALRVRALDARRASGWKRKTCGVCTKRRVVRSMVRSTCPPSSTCFTVSITGKAGMAAPSSRARPQTRAPAKPGEAKGRAAS